MYLLINTIVYISDRR